MKQLSRAIALACLLVSAAAAGAVENKKDVAYGPHERQKYDFYAPNNSDGKPAPVIISFHGGGLVSGEKGKGPDRQMLKEGIAWVDAGYRLIKHSTEDGVQPPIMGTLKDGARVVQHVRAHAKEYNIDPDRVAVTGGSAGGLMSLWIGLHDEMADPRSEDGVARQSTRVTAIGVRRPQVTRDPLVIAQFMKQYERPGDPKRELGENSYPQFGWGTPVDKDKFDQSIVNEYSPSFHLSADDPPIMVSHESVRQGVANPRETFLKFDPKVGWGHHPGQGKYLYDLCKKMNHECHMFSVDFNESTTAEKLVYRTLNSFLMHKLTGRMPPENSAPAAAGDGDDAAAVK